MKRKITIFICSVLTTLIFAQEQRSVESSIVGAWQGFIVHHSGQFTCRTNIKYIFSSDKTWSIQEQQQNKIPQGWYRIDKRKLLLQPQQAVVQNMNAVITAEIIDDNNFEIPNPIDNTYKMRFIRISVLPILTDDGIIGKWKILQKNLYTNELKTAPYLLIIDKNGTYKLEQPEMELPQEWASGKYEILDSLLRLTNAYSGEGLWNKPVFFFLDGNLIYNNAQYSLWCERVESK